MVRGLLIHHCFQKHYNFPEKLQYWWNFIPHSWKSVWYEVIPSWQQDMHYTEISSCSWWRGLVVFIRMVLNITTVFWCSLASTLNMVVNVICGIRIWSSHKRLKPLLNLVKSIITYIFLKCKWSIRDNTKIIIRQHLESIVRFCIKILVTVYVY